MSPVAMSWSTARMTSTCTPFFLHDVAAEVYQALGVADFKRAFEGAIDEHGA
jgi:hypothetical protein